MFTQSNKRQLRTNYIYRNSLTQLVIHYFYNKICVDFLEHIQKYCLMNLCIFFYGKMLDYQNIVHQVHFLFDTPKILENFIIPPHWENPAHVTMHLDGLGCLRLLTTYI